MNLYKNLKNIGVLAVLAGVFYSPFSYGETEKTKSSFEQLEKKFETELNSNPIIIETEEGEKQIKNLKDYINYSTILSSKAVSKMQDGLSILEKAVTDRKISPDEALLAKYNLEEAEENYHAFAPLYRRFLIQEKKYPQYDTAIKQFDDYCEKNILKISVNHDSLDYKGHVALKRLNAISKGNMPQKIESGIYRFIPFVGENEEIDEFVHSSNFIDSIEASSIFAIPVLVAILVGGIKDRRKQIKLQSANPSQPQPLQSQPPEPQESIYIPLPDPWSIKTPEIKSIIGER